MIEVKYVTKYYKEYVALEKVYLNVNPGDVVGILGENGAGKTTLLKAIANLVPLNVGEILIDGEPAEGRVYNKLSFITEEGSFFPHLTPLDHEEFLAYNFEKFNRVRFNKLLDFFQIDRTKRLGSFSKGQKAKFEAACGFSKGAKYILMDEPFLGKDIFTRRDFLKLMIAGMEEDEAIVIATHLIEEIENVLTRAVILKDGRVKENIKMEELKERGSTLADAMKNAAGYKENRVLSMLESCDD